MNRGLLFVMSGPSGTGKGTICEALLKTEDLFLSVSTTSRNKRAGEEEGVTYHYTTREGFEKLIRDDEMLEYAEYGGNYYGTPKKTVENMLNEGKNVLLEIEPQGALHVKSIFADAILLFVIPPSMKELKNRLSERGRETEEQIKERMQIAVWEFEQSSKYNYIVINDDLDRCVKEVKEIIERKTTDAARVNALLEEQY